MRSCAGRFTDCEGLERRLGWDDVLVVTPYNAQVRCLRKRLGARARIGTVDKFQGREAPVVFFSMATSRGTTSRAIWSSCSHGIA
jgi:superfamily I DNA and/or RNA helicase